MVNNVGLWIDHRKAVLVFLSDSGEELKQIESNVEKHVRATGGSRTSTAYGPQDVAAGDVQERRLMQHLNAYYHEVIKLLRDADSILLLGPGEAKIEFQKQIKSKELRQRVVGVETADKLTDRQLIAKVREYFNATAVR